MKNGGFDVQEVEANWEVCPLSDLRREVTTWFEREITLEDVVIAGSKV